MNETQKNIIESQVAYSVDQGEEAFNAAQNAFDSAIEQNLSREEAGEVWEAVYTQLS